MAKAKQDKPALRRSTVENLDGASSFRSFRGKVKKTPSPKPKAPSRRVKPDKGELSPR